MKGCETCRWQRYDCGVLGGCSYRNHYASYEKNIEEPCAVCGKPRAPRLLGEFCSFECQGK